MASWFVLEAVVFLASVLTHSLRVINFILSDSQQHKLVLHEVAIASQNFPCDFNTRMLNCTSVVYHCYWQLILLLETTIGQEANLKCRGRAVPREALLKKRDFAARSAAAIFSKCAPLDAKQSLFQRCNILASFSDLTNSPAQHSILYVENGLGHSKKMFSFSSVTSRTAMRAGGLLLLLLQNVQCI